jgi:hypothetical protein
MGKAMSKNDGGETVKLARDLVDAPDIPRGAMFPRGVFRGAERITFDLAAGKMVDGVWHAWRLTYHDIGVISDGSMTATQVFVTPQDVVTWERL